MNIERRGGYFTQRMTAEDRRELVERVEAQCHDQSGLVKGSDCGNRDSAQLSSWVVHHAARSRNRELGRVVQ